MQGLTEFQDNDYEGTSSSRSSTCTSYGYRLEGSMTLWEVLISMYASAFIAIVSAWLFFKLLDWFYYNGYSYKIIAAILIFIFWNILVYVVYLIQ